MGIGTIARILRDGRVAKRRVFDVTLVRNSTESFVGIEKLSVVKLLQDISELNNATHFFCPKCTKAFASWKNLGRHCIAQHQWSLSKSAPLVARPAPSAKNQPTDMEPGEVDAIEMAAATMRPSNEVQLASKNIAVTHHESVTETSNGRAAAGALKALTSHDLTAKEKFTSPERWQSTLRQGRRREQRRTEGVLPC